MNLTQTIVDDLGHKIVLGHFGDKDPFPTEASLCETYDASRSVLREAVKMLTAKGLLAARPRQGTRVQPTAAWNLLDPDVLRWHLETKPSLDLLCEFAEFRLSIEPEAAALAAARAGREKKLKIEKALERMRAADEGDDDPLLSDIEFHLAILEASGNRFFIQMKALVETALRISIRLTNQIKGVPRASVTDHAAVAQAIAAGKADEARATMVVLLTEVSELIEKARKRNARKRR